MVACLLYIIQVHGIPEYINTFLPVYHHQVFSMDILQFLFGILE